ncbi:MFS transporter [Vibrio sp. S4M6]|nr:MFS transporter [Vibrio sinus]
MGVGQNGLLVSLPYLVNISAFQLPTWSIVIAIGSFLFLPSAPFWGRFSDKHGPKIVVSQALIGMAVSFFLIFLFTKLSATHTQHTLILLTGLVIARIIYGLTVSGMVPAAQHWAILLAQSSGSKDLDAEEREQKRVKAIAGVSVGLSSGRLIGPLLAIGLLKMSPFAPIAIMAIFPTLALIAVLFLPKPQSQHSVASNKANHLGWLPPKSILPFLFTAFSLCVTVALIQYSFTPMITAITAWPIEKVSNTIGILLSFGALATFLSQVTLIKKKRLDMSSMYRLGAICLVVGYILYLFGNIWLFGAAIILCSCGSALLVPAYTAKATSTSSGSPGVVSGYISMFHTLGYGFASLLAFTASISAQIPVLISLLLSFIILLVAYLITAKPIPESSRNHTAKNAS